MGLTYKIRYKNHCTPQEQILTDGRWYLDSDSGRKLTGDAEATSGYTALANYLTAIGTLTPDVSISDSATSIASSKDFVYVKNTGSNDVFISLAGTADAKFVIVLSEGEAFASEISTSANVRVKCASGETSTIEYFTET